MEELRSRSAGGARYRAISSKSAIDESLFGPSQIDKRSAEAARKEKKLTALNSAKGYVVISASDLENIKRASIIKTDADIQAERDEIEKENAIKLKISRDRKIKMKELELKSNERRVKSDLEVEEEAKQAALRQLAKNQIDNNNDAVKALNSMAAKAVTFQLRDMQKLEKSQHQEKEKDYDNRMDLVMEIDRLKDLSSREELEKNKISKRIKDRSVIIEQIKFREKLRYLAAEAREQENVEMRKTMAKYKEEDEKKERLRQEQVAKSQIEFTLANEVLLQRKKDVKLNEKKEMEQILVYQAMKDAELRKREEDEAEIVRQKKARQLELLAQQEKAQDNAGKMDEIRARRAAEERERRARQRERDDREKKKREVDELLAVRHIQAEDKKRRQDAMRLDALKEIEDGVKFRADMKAREDEELSRIDKLREEHRVNLHKQIEMRRSNVQGSRDDNLNIGSEYRQKLIADETRLKVIRDRMVQDLLGKGVNNAYLAEMRNCDLRKLINR